MERGKIIENTLSQIERQYGIGSIMKLGDADKIKKIDVISTG